MKTLKELTAVASLLAALGGCPNEKQTIDNGQQLAAGVSVKPEAAVDPEMIRAETKKGLTAWYESYLDDKLTLNDCLVKLSEAKSDLEKIGDGQTAAYASVLTQLGSVHRQLAVQGIEETLPKVTFSGDHARIERKDTAQSRMSVKERLAESRRLYEKVIGLLDKHPGLELREDQKTAPYFGLAHSCRLVQDYDCARKAYHDARRWTFPGSKEMGSILRMERFLEKDYLEHLKYSK